MDNQQYPNNNQQAPQQPQRPRNPFFGNPYVGGNQQNDQQNRCRGTFCLVVFRGGLIHE